MMAVYGVGTARVCPAVRYNSPMLISLWGHKICQDQELLLKRLPVGDTVLHITGMSILYWKARKCPPSRRKGENENPSTNDGVMTISGSIIPGTGFRRLRSLRYTEAEYPIGEVFTYKILYVPAVVYSGRLIKYTELKFTLPVKCNFQKVGRRI